MDIDFTMREGGKITGRVTGDGDAPLENARVSARPYDDSWFDAWGETNANGIYTITGLVDVIHILTLHDAIYSARRDIGTVEQAFSKAFDDSQFRLKTERTTQLSMKGPSNGKEEDAFPGQFRRRA